MAKSKKTNQKKQNSNQQQVIDQHDQMSDSLDKAHSILRNLQQGLTEEQKEQAIKKEEQYRLLYNKFFDFNQTRSLPDLCNMLLDGYDKMNSFYKQNKEGKDDINYIIKFAFRDFFLLMFINMKQIFDESEFLKNLHKTVYFSDNYVDIEHFEKLVDFCQKTIKNASKK